jgi:hypothetical protein
VNRVVISETVIHAIAMLAESNPEAGEAVLRRIALMSVMSPNNPHFPGYAVQLGPMVAVMIYGHRLEVRRVEGDPPPDYPEAEYGSWFVYKLATPDEQLIEQSVIG